MKKLILAIDDDLSIRLLIDFILRKNYEIVTKEKGIDAVLWMEKGNIPDLIIADLEMPDLNFLDFISSIRRSGYFRNVPIIALGSHSGADEALHIELEHRITELILKPFNPKTLEEKIERYLASTTLNQFKDEQAI